MPDFFIEIRHLIYGSALNIPTESTYDGIRRIDFWRFPLKAVREALLNLIVHRDYALFGGSRINIFSDHLEFISRGGLPPHMTPEDLENHLSVPRNRYLARVFEKLGFIEAMGIGLPLIRRLYKHAPVQPIISPAPNSFRVVLPALKPVDMTDTADAEEQKVEKINRPLEKQIVSVSNTTDKVALCNSISSALSSSAGSSKRASAALARAERALAFAKQKKSFTRSDLQKELGLSQTLTSRLLKGMVDEGKLLKIDSGKRTRFTLANTANERSDE